MRVPYITDWENQQVKKSGQNAYLQHILTFKEHFNVWKYIIHQYKLFTCIFEINIEVCLYFELMLLTFHILWIEIQWLRSIEPLYLFHAQRMDDTSYA